MVKLEAMPIAENVSVSRSIVEITLAQQGMKTLVPKQVKRFQRKWLWRTASFEAKCLHVVEFMLNCSLMICGGLWAFVELFCLVMFLFLSLPSWAQGLAWSLPWVVVVIVALMFLIYYLQDRFGVVEKSWHVLPVESTVRLPNSLRQKLNQIQERVVGYCLDGYVEWLTVSPTQQFIFLKLKMGDCEYWIDHYEGPVVIK